MANPLNLFPARVPIGRATGADGRTVDVLMTPEFARALSDLLVRVGGSNGIAPDDLASLLNTSPGDTAALTSVQYLVADLQDQLAAAVAATARLAALERRFADLEALANSAGPVPTDWTHPGKIGAGKANSGQFTTVNRVTITAPVGGATLTIADGKTFWAANSISFNGVDGKTLTLNNSLGLSGTDGSTLDIGTGGVLKSAAFQPTSAFAARATSSLGAAATDPASTQTLANTIRGVLLAVGIGS